MKDPRIVRMRSSARLAGVLSCNELDANVRRNVIACRAKMHRATVKTPIDRNRQKRQRRKRQRQ